MQPDKPERMAAPRDGGRADVLVIGGGPAGLTAAYELLRGHGGRPTDRTPLVIEAGDQVGGISRTAQYKGYRFDIGGHRFFTKVNEVNVVWDEVIEDQFIDVARQSRIFYRGKYYDYPLSPTNAVRNLGPYETVRIMLSLAKWKLRPSKVEDNFEQWVTNRFGGRLYWHFFRTYTEKVWGIPCTEIRSDWAAQRIKDLSLTKAVMDALTGGSKTTSLIKTFKYPRLGPGQMWEMFARRVEDRGGEVRMQTRVVGFKRDGNRVTSATLRDYAGVEKKVDRGLTPDVDDAQGRTYEVEADAFVNSMPITRLVRSFDPPAPDHVLEAAGNLRYRDFLIVTLILESEDLFPDNWIYIHSPEVKVGRIQNFRSWSDAMVPNPKHASIGMEYFCHAGDGLWTMPDDELIALAKKELGELKLAHAGDVVDGTVIRQPKAYPVYDADYKENLAVVQAWVEGLENLQTVGRNGMHRYNNQDHSMLSALLAARNIMGEDHDLWNVNVERSYHEDMVVDEKNPAARAAAMPGKAAASASA